MVAREKVELRCTWKKRELFAKRQTDFDFDLVEWPGTMGYPRRYAAGCKGLLRKAGHFMWEVPVIWGS